MINVKKGNPIILYSQGHEFYDTHPNIIGNIIIYNTTTNKRVYNTVNNTVTFTDENGRITIPDIITTTDQYSHTFQHRDQKTENRDFTLQVQGIPRLNIRNSIADRRKL